MIRNPALQTRADEINDAETIIAHQIAAAKCFEAILSRAQRPEDVAEILAAAGHIAVSKHVAQRMRDRASKNGLSRQDD